MQTASRQPEGAPLCVAVIGGASRARTLLGFEPRILIPEWLENLLPAHAQGEAIFSAEADADMRQRGLIR